MSATPGVTFVIPVLNAAQLLPRCLESIRAQEYPKDLIQVIVADGGSTDATADIVERLGFELVPNPRRLAEPGVVLGMSLARHEIRVVLAADNELVGNDWLCRVVAALECSGAKGVYTHIVNTPLDAPFCRYLNHLHADPFNWFVYGPGADPKRFGDAFPVQESEPSHVVYDFAGAERPLLAIAQGFTIRGELPRGAHNEEDDVLPLWELIDRGGRLAYVDVGIGHHPVASFGDFLGKYRRRTASVLRSQAGGYRARATRLGPRQRRRRLLWLPYSLSVLGPLIHALRGVARDRQLVWLWHPVACLGLSFSILRAVVDVKLERAEGESPSSGATPSGYRSSRTRAAPGVTLLPPHGGASTRERVTSALGDLAALPIVAFGPRRQVELHGRAVALEYDFRRWAWRSERCVEIGLGRVALGAHPPDGVLEVGNVMPLAGVAGHTVVDKYELGAGVVNEDIVDFRPGRRYELVLSLSTLEHVGWDEEPRDPEKAPMALGAMAALVESGGSMLVTIPVGVHRTLEEAFLASDSPFEHVTLVGKRSRLARWAQLPLQERTSIRYGSPYANGNAILLGVSGDPLAVRHESPPRPG